MSPQYPLLYTPIPAVLSRFHHLLNLTTHAFIHPRRHKPLMLLYSLSLSIQQLLQAIIHFHHSHPLCPLASPTYPTGTQEPQQPSHILYTSHPSSQTTSSVYLAIVSFGPLSYTGDSNLFAPSPAFLGSSQYTYSLPSLREYKSEGLSAPIYPTISPSP